MGWSFQADIDIAAPFRERHVIERVLAPIELGGDVDAGHDRQPTVQIVAPAMIGADEVFAAQFAAFAVLAGAQGRASVAAGVVKGAQLALIVAHHQDALGADGEGSERARRRQNGAAAEINPVTVPQGPQLALIMDGIDIEAAGKGGLEPLEAQIGGWRCEGGGRCHRTVRSLEGSDRSLIDATSLGAMRSPTISAKHHIENSTEARSRDVPTSITHERPQHRPQLARPRQDV